MSIEYKWNIPKVPLFNAKSAQMVFNKEATRSLNIMTSVVSTNVSFSAPAGATGRLKNSIGTSVSNNVGRVFTGVKYAGVIERGRRAAPVSMDADLERWIRLSKKGQRYFASLKAKYPKITIRGAAFILRRSMKLKPRKPNPFFSRGVKRSEKRLRLEAGVLNRRLAVGLMT